MAEEEEKEAWDETLWVAEAVVRREEEVVVPLVQRVLQGGGDEG